MSSAVLAHVARLHYERELSKQEIGRRLGISRFRVARLLEQARDEGVVRIEIRDSLRVAEPLARDLEERFDLDFAIVVPTRDVAAAAAGLLPGLLDDSSVLGVAWGQTLAAVAGALEPFPRPVPVVQICGVVPGLEPGTGPTELAASLAAKAGGPFHPLPAPAFATRAARDALLANDAIRPAVERFADVTLALVGIGAHEAGGHVLVHAFDRDGRLVDTAMSDLAIALPLLPPRQARVLAVAGGATKHDAVRGALRAGLVDLLVTDIGCAEAALS
jgi:DNA-binding transcriptional regulator LsrR (DeoR family)